MAKNLGKVVVVVARNSGAADAPLLLHCLLPLKALVHLHHHPLAVVVADFLVSSLIPSAWLLYTSLPESLSNDVLCPQFFSPHDRMYEYGPCNSDFRFVPRWNKRMYDELLPTLG
ncbi:hypothetical protein PIB30_046515 [Stylosanthes scabra]|uniref:Fucosyltransferase n=1 Tax=Stylosanthes scabra TaxID=79078 RepID=A0ABU6YHJ8_9FABA|nr:hypothetical protein [Stylosanthes scabra]